MPQDSDAEAMGGGCGALAFGIRKAQARVDTLTDDRDEQAKDMGTRATTVFSLRVAGMAS